MMEKKKLYFAPLEGVAGYIFRNIYADFFDDVDKYFSPFVVTRPSGIMKNKELRDILPENNENISLVPQILANNADGFYKCGRTNGNLVIMKLILISAVRQEQLFQRREEQVFKIPEELDEFLDRIYTECDMKISVKTRIGFENPGRDLQAD